MSLVARIMARGEPPARTRVMPPPEPGVPGWEQIAGEIIIIRRQQPSDAVESPDRIVFGPYRKALAEDADYGL